MKVIYILIPLLLLGSCASKLPALARQPELGVTSQALVGDPLYRSKISSGSSAITRELIYSGISDGQLLLSYREYSSESAGGSNPALPAFSQDLLCDISDNPITLNYKTVKINVTNATSADIEYSVETGFWDEEALEGL